MYMCRTSDLENPEVQACTDILSLPTYLPLGKVQAVCTVGASKVHTSISGKSNQHRRGGVHSMLTNELMWTEGEWRVSNNLRT